MSESEVAVLAQKIDGLQELMESRFKGLDDRLDLVTGSLRRDLDDTNAVVERRFIEHQQEHVRLTNEDGRLADAIMRLQSRMESIEKIGAEHKQLEEADKRLADTVKVNSGRITELERAGPSKDQKTLRWIGTTIGALLIAGLLGLAGYGVVHAIEQGLANGKSVQMQQGNTVPGKP